jgi:hypothetical protein
LMILITKAMQILYASLLLHIDCRGDRRILVDGKF